MMYEAARKELLETVMRLSQQNLIPLDSGNASVRVSDDTVAITPSGVSYERMSVEDTVIIDLSGKVLEGRRFPSSETPMHTTIYKNISQVAAIVHTHSIYALAFAVAGRGIPVICTEGLPIQGPIPVAEYACPGTEAQGLVAVAAMKGPPKVTGTLLKNHGVLATGRSLSQAYSNALRIEIAAKVFFLASQVGSPNILTDEQVKEIFATYSLIRQGTR